MPLPVADRDALHVYLDQIGAHHCRSLIRARAADVLSFRRVSITARTVGEAQKQVFGECLLETETLRQQRQTLHKDAASWICNNVIIDLPDSLYTDREAILSWPHWLLKLLYCRVEVMYGKFWVGQELLGTNGIAIPPPPMNFISMRAAVPKVDAIKFFSAAPHLRALAENSHDYGQDVLLQLLNLPRPASDSFALDQYFQAALDWAKEYSAK